MRYVLVGIAGLLLVAVVVGQEGLAPPPGADVNVPGVDDFTPRVPPPLVDNAFTPFADSQPAIPGLPPVMSLGEGQAAKLREAIGLTGTAVADLKKAAELFRQADSGATADEVRQAAESAGTAAAMVSARLRDREKAISQRLMELEAEVARLKEELRRTQDGRPEPAPAVDDVFGPVGR